MDVYVSVYVDVHVHVDVYVYASVNFLLYMYICVYIYIYICRNNRVEAPAAVPGGISAGLTLACSEGPARRT